MIAVLILIAFVFGGAFVFAGFVLGRSGITVIHEEKPLSTFQSNILEPFKTWEDEKKEA